MKEAKIYTAIKYGEKEDFLFQLTNNQKLEIEIARKQVENGETEDWESVLNRLSKKTSLL
ncbi:MAG: hypothetical protein WD048_05375 [Chitinophagales bacterium]